MTKGNGNGRKNGNGQKNGGNGGTDSQGEVTRPHTVIKRAAFLEAFRDCGIIRVAADVAGVNRRSHYDWLKQSPEYVEQFATATTEALEDLVAEARKRATTGAEKLIFYKGEPITIPCNKGDVGSFPDPALKGHFRRFYLEYTKSDLLLMFLIKKLDPSYREGYESALPESHEASWMDLTRDEATVRKAMESIDRLPLDEEQKQKLRDSITVDE